MFRLAKASINSESLLQILASQKVEEPSRLSNDGSFRSPDIEYADILPRPMQVSIQKNFTLDGSMQSRNVDKERCSTVTRFLAYDHPRHELAVERRKTTMVEASAAGREYHRCIHCADDRAADDHTQQEPCRD